jgi:uncharacterized RDD family membrane protein YckC
MSWYYAENNERRGPIDEAAFQSLVNAGTIQPDTLVWRDGFADWMPYRSAVGAASAASTSPAGASGTSSSSAVACSQCGRLFPADETVTYEGRHVCAGCKPLFFQKVREGVLVVGERDYAGFWIRFCATFVDWFILNIIGRVVGMIVGFFFGLTSVGNKTVMGMAVGASIVVLLLVVAAYSIFFTGKYGATPGKMACKLQVIRADNSPMTYGRAAARFFGGVLSVFTLYIGFIIAAFDVERRSLADRICDTRVVRKQGR